MLRASLILSEIMTLRHLAKAFEDRFKLPIELPEIRDEIVRLGIQDKIIFSDEDMDPANCRGIFCQYTTRPGVYAEPHLITLIVYSRRLSLDWQRMVCCKEIVHVLDKQENRTRTPEEVVGLADKLLGPLSTEDYGLADFMAAQDRIALYQGLAVIFPPAAYKIARASLKNGTKTIDEIAAWSCLPKQLVTFALQDDWLSFREDLFNC